MRDINIAIKQLQKDIEKQVFSGFINKITIEHTCAVWKLGALTLQQLSTIQPVMKKQPKEVLMFLLTTRFPCPVKNNNMIK